jgi:hypothetical protein
MRAFLLTIVACLLASCVSAPREREAQCLAATMMDTWQAEHDLNTAEEAWRLAQQARFQRSSAHRDSSALSDWFASPSGIIEQVSVHGGAVNLVQTDSDEERTLYHRTSDAHARYGEKVKWYRLVARRVQTRIEEDEMLYPLLGMLATPTAILVYPFVRWNVRSVLWDGVDPDAENDPVQIFCAARLGQELHAPHP